MKNDTEVAAPRSVRFLTTATPSIRSTLSAQSTQSQNKPQLISGDVDSVDLNVSRDQDDMAEKAEKTEKAENVEKAKGEQMEEIWEWQMNRATGKRVRVLKLKPQQLISPSPAFPLDDVESDDIENVDSKTRAKIEGLSHIEGNEEDLETTRKMTHSVRSTRRRLKSVKSLKTLKSTVSTSLDDQNHDKHAISKSLSRTKPTQHQIQKFKSPPLKLVENEPNQKSIAILTSSEFVRTETGKKQRSIFPSSQDDQQMNTKNSSFDVGFKKNDVEQEFESDHSTDHSIDHEHAQSRESREKIQSTQRLRSLLPTTLQVPRTRIHRTRNFRKNSHHSFTLRSGPPHAPNPSNASNLSNPSNSLNPSNSPNPSDLIQEEQDQSETQEHLLQLQTTSGSDQLLRILASILAEKTLIKQTNENATREL